MDKPDKQVARFYFSLPFPSADLQTTFYFAPLYYTIGPFFISSSFSFLCTPANSTAQRGLSAVDSSVTSQPPYDDSSNQLSRSTSRFTAIESTENKSLPFALWTNF